MTVKQFLLKKYPTNEYIDCPVPKHHWETMQEYANAYHESKVKELNLHSVSGLLPDQEKIKAMAMENADKWEKYGYSRGNLYDYFIMGAEAVVELIKGNNR